MVGAGAVYPFGRAAVTDGGHIVSGRWSYSSGCQHSSWLTVFCHVFDGDAPRLTAASTPEVRVAFVPTTGAVIHDTWDVSGLVGTGSHDFTIEPVFVPEAYSYRLWPGAPRGGAFQGPLYRFPFWGFFAVPIGAVALGIAQGAVDACMEIAQGRGRSGRPELHRSTDVSGQARRKRGVASGGSNLAPRGGRPGLGRHDDAWLGLPAGADRSPPGGDARDPYRRGSRPHGVYRSRRERELSPKPAAAGSPRRPRGNATRRGRHALV
jgi:hypothetical protein